MKKLSSKKIALLGILTALALISYLLEGLLPPLMIPGAKLGISNVFTLLAICLLSPQSGIILIVVRTTLASLIAGSMSSLLYSLTAGLVATLIMSLLWRYVNSRLSILAISVVGAVIHNITQDLVYFAVTGSQYVLSYMPYLVLIGVFSGAIVGFLTTLIEDRMKNIASFN